MRKTLLFAFLTVAMTGTAGNDETHMAKSAAVPMPPYAVFTDGFHKDITPKGWLREILERQNNGLTSHPEAMSYPLIQSYGSVSLSVTRKTGGLTGGVMSRRLIMLTV